MNYVVAMMLIVVKDEEKSFFLFEQLTKRILIGEQNGTSQLIYLFLTLECVLELTIHVCVNLFLSTVW